MEGSSFMVCIELADRVRACQHHLAESCWEWCAKNCCSWAVSASAYAKSEECTKAG